MKKEAVVSQTFANPVIQQIGYGPQPAGAFKTQNVLIAGNAAFVSGGATVPTIEIYDISDPTHPVQAGSINAAGNYLAADQNGFLYWGGSGSTYMYIADVRNIHAPVITGTLNFTSLAGAIYGTAVSGNYVYLATQNKGLTVVDVSNPYAPAQKYQEGGTLNKSVGVAVGPNKKVYTTNYQTTSPWTVRYLKTWDVTNPTAPVLQNTFILPAGTKPTEVSIVGSYAYVSDSNTSSVQIIDITNPLVPVYKGSMFATNTFGVGNNAAIQGNYAYVASGSSAAYGGAIDMFDITNPSSPVKLSTFKEGVPTSVYGPVVISNNILYVADYGVAPGSGGGLRVYSTPTAITNPIPTANMSRVSSQLSGFNSSASGVAQLQGSNDIVTSSTNNPPSDWSNIGTATTISGAGTYLIPSVAVSYNYIRLFYTNLGSSGFTAKTKVMG